MDNKTIEALGGLVRALKAFSKSVERSLHTGLYEGTGDTVVKQYRALQAKAMQILPDDFYIQEVFTPQIIDSNDDEQKCTQVRLVVNQLEDYLQALLKDETEQNFVFRGEEGDLRGVGKELQEQILEITRKTLKRAFSQIDIGSAAEAPDAPIPPVPPEPPIPPIPPEPPIPPMRPGR